MTFNSGSGNAINYRTLVTGSSSTEYYQPVSNIGGSTNGLGRNATRKTTAFGSAQVNPLVIMKMNDGTIYLGTVSTPIASLNLSATGNQGTPI